MIECKLNTPDITPELARSAVNVLTDYLNKDLLELPAQIGNTVIYLNNGKPEMMTCADRKQAQGMARQLRGLIHD